MNKVSIIIPIYNCESYLVTCLNSVKQQTYKNIEVLLVDDGSQDKSVDICQKFVEIDNRFLLFKKENGGVSSARNLGITKSSGDFITFVDGDDWLDENAISNMVDSQRQNDADIVCASLNTIWPHANEKVLLPDMKSNLNDKKNTCEVLYTIHEGSVAKLYKKEIIDKYNMIFNEAVSNGEDSIFIHEYFSLCNSINFIAKVVYQYNKLENNTLVSRYNHDLEKWRTIELAARLKAYKIWSRTTEEYKNYKNMRSTYVLEELIDYYSEKSDDIFENRILDFYNNNNLLIDECTSEYSMYLRDNKLLELKKRYIKTKNKAKDNLVIKKVKRIIKTVTGEIKKKKYKSKTI